MVKGTSGHLHCVPGYYRTEDGDICLSYHGDHKTDMVKGTSGHLHCVPGYYRTEDGDICLSYHGDHKTVIW